METELPRKEPIEPSPNERIRSSYNAPSESPGKELHIELIPLSMHFKNARAVVPEDIWGLLRSICFNLDGRRCGECNSNENLECHEEWEFRTAPTRVMKLTRLRALCHLCHRCKHIGLAKGSVEYPEVEKHAMEHHGLSKEQLAQRARLAYEVVRERDLGGMYELDLTYLNDEIFLWVHHRFRKFGQNEIENCRESITDDLDS